MLTVMLIITSPYMSDFPTCGIGSWLLDRSVFLLFFFFQAEDGIRDKLVTGVQTCALPISAREVAALLKDPLVKEDAALALEDLGGRGQVDALLDAVDTTVGAGSDAAARAANRTNARIAEALGNIGDPRAGPALLRLARATDDTVRLAAVEALGNVKATEAIPELSH